MTTGPRPSNLRFITTFGLGYMRPASGTWGSLPPVIVAGVLLAFGAGPEQQPWVYFPVLVAMLVVFGAACVVQGDEAEARFGEKDPTNVVADETAGQCIPLLLIPHACLTDWRYQVFTLAFAFVGFRILDIVKPWPARQLQAVPGGWGILLDDLFAGLYAGLILILVAAIALR